MGSYVADDFVHHNQRFKGVRATMIKTLEKTAKTFPKLLSKRVRTLEDGDFVIVQSHIQPVPGSKRGSGLAYVHIFRFDKDKIVEMWDLGQTIPPEIINENGVF